MEIHIWGHIVHHTWIRFGIHYTYSQEADNSNTVK
jgi:hypothetical protein